MEAGRGAAPFLSPIEQSIRRIAHNTARVLKLRLLSIDVTQSDGINYVTFVNAMPRLSEFKILTGLAAEPLIIAEAEIQSRSWARHRGSDLESRIAKQEST